MTRDELIKQVPYSDIHEGINKGVSEGRNDSKIISFGFSLDSIGVKGGTRI